MSISGIIRLCFGRAAVLPVFVLGLMAIVAALGWFVVAPAMAQTPDELPRCIDPPDDSDGFVVEVPFIQTFEGTITIDGAVPTLGDERATRIYAHVGVGDDQCLGGTAEIGTDGGVFMQAGLYHIAVNGIMDLVRNKPIFFYLEDRQTLAVTDPPHQIIFFDSIVGVQALDLNFPNYPIVPPVPEVDPVTFRGQAFSSQSPGGLVGVKIAVRITNEAGDVYVSEAGITDAGGNFLVTADPGTQDYVGRDVEFIVPGTDAVGAQTVPFPGGGTQFVSVEVAFGTIMQPALIDLTEIRARLDQASVYRDGEVKLIVTRTADLDSVVNVVVVVDDPGTVLMDLPNPVVNLSLEAMQSSAELVFMTKSPDEEDDAVASTVTLGLSTETEGFEILESNLSFTVEGSADPGGGDTASSGSCGGGDTASLDNLVLLGLPLAAGVSLLGGGAMRFARRRLKMRSDNEI